MDPIADFLTAIRNASSKGLEKADIPYSKIKFAIAKVLKEEGYISGFRSMEETQKQFIRVQLRYTDDRKPVISGIERVSKPGLRIYRSWKGLPKVNGGMGIAVLSASTGVMTDKRARQMKCGGEVLCKVW